MDKDQTTGAGHHDHMAHLRKSIENIPTGGDMGHVKFALDIIATILEKQEARQASDAPASSHNAGPIGHIES